VPNPDTRLRETASNVARRAVNGSKSTFPLPDIGKLRTVVGSVRPLGQTVRLKTHRFSEIRGNLD